MKDLTLMKSFKGVVSEKTIIQVLGRTCDSSSQIRRIAACSTLNTSCRRSVDSWGWIINKTIWMLLDVFCTKLLLLVNPRSCWTELRKMRVILILYAYVSRCCIAMRQLFSRDKNRSKFASRIVNDRDISISGSNLFLVWKSYYSEKNHLMFSPGVPTPFFCYEESKLTSISMIRRVEVSLLCAVWRSQWQSQF